MTDKFDDFVNSIRQASAELAKETLNGLESKAQADADAFTKKYADKLREWTNLLATKQISKDEFSDLIEAKLSLAEIHSLTLLGIETAKIERFRTGLIKLFSDKASVIFR